MGEGERMTAGKRCRWIVREQEKEREMAEDDEKLRNTKFNTELSDEGSRR